ncbi:hypothetical protein EI94DRAFT_1756262 [Lactarius quietus]|nr:hypothetical protein EI94DRAFT_1756262 [Lactarius quietus]
MNPPHRFQSRNPHHQLGRLKSLPFLAERTLPRSLPSFRGQSQYTGHKVPASATRKLRPFIRTHPSRFS